MNPSPGGSRVENCILLKCKGGIVTFLELLTSDGKCSIPERKLSLFLGLYKGVSIFTFLILKLLELFRTSSGMMNGVTEEDSDDRLSTEVERFISFFHSEGSS